MLTQDTGVAGESVNRSSQAHLQAARNTILDRVRHDDPIGHTTRTAGVSRHARISFVKIEEKLKILDDELNEEHCDIGLARADAVALGEALRALKAGVLKQSVSKQEEIDSLGYKLKLAEEANSALTRENKELKEDLERESEGRAKYQISNKALVRQLEDMVSADDYFEMKEENMNVQAILNQKTKRSSDMQVQINQLSEDSAIKEPLVQIGAAIRLRFLVQARKEITKTDLHSELSRQLLDSGNIAAHNGILRADVALFKSGLIPQAYITAAKAVFQNLYQAQPTNYDQLNPLDERLSNCIATNRARRKTDSSDKQRKELFDLMSQLTEWQNADELSLTRYSDLVTAMEMKTNEIIELDLSHSRFMRAHRRASNSG